MDSFLDALHSALQKQMQSETMDDLRPLSLANVCTLCNARIIEGRTASKLGPLSERLGQIILKLGIVAIASNVVSSEDPFRNLSDDILQHILARLPLFPFKAAKKVCKRWALVTTTPEFKILRKKLKPKPRLVPCGISYLSLSKSQWFAYDVENDAWVTLPALQLPAHNYGSLAVASGVVFAVAGPGDDRLLYKLTSFASSAESFGESWYETPVMTFPRSSPVVSVALGAGMGHKVVVAGGGSDDRDDGRAGHRAVEVFDSEIGTWESYGDLPEEFSVYNSGIWMSGLMCDNKFYVSSVHKFENDKIQIHSLDFYTKQWASIQLVCPMDLMYSRIMAIGTTLVVAGLCQDENKDFAVKLWKVDLKTLSLIQIGLMPRGWAVLLEKLLENFIPLSFLVDENLVYVYMDVFMRVGQLVVAEVSLEECKTYWRILPAVRSPMPYDEGLITFCASISFAQIS